MPQHQNVAAAIFGFSNNAYFMYRALERRAIDRFVFSEKPGKNFGNIPTIRCPSSADPGALLVFLEAFASARPALLFVVLPDSDEYAIFFSTYKDRLPERFIVKCPGRAAVQTCTNKQRFSEFCASNGLNAPATFVFGSRSELEGSSRAIRYPVIVKAPLPQNGSGLQFPKVILAHDREQLLQMGESVWAHGCSLLFQEYIPGGHASIVFVGGYVNRQSGIQELFVGTKEMEYPILGGTTTCCRLEWQDDAVAASLRLLDLLDYEGLFDIEYKRDKRSGTLPIIEINPRIGLWHRVSEDGGMDIVSYYVLTASGTRAPEQITYRAHAEGRVWVALYKHLVACIECFGLVRGLRLWKRDVQRPTRVRDDRRSDWRRLAAHASNLLGRCRELGWGAMLKGVGNESGT